MIIMMTFLCSVLRSNIWSSNKAWSKCTVCVSLEKWHISLSSNTNLGVHDVMRINLKPVTRLGFYIWGKRTKLLLRQVLYFDRGWSEVIQLFGILDVNLQEAKRQSNKESFCVLQFLVSASSHMCVRTITRVQKSPFKLHLQVKLLSTYIMSIWSYTWLRYLRFWP